MLTDAEIVALAINNEKEASRIYREFAESLEPDYPDSARLFTEMAGEESEHEARLTSLFTSKFHKPIPDTRKIEIDGVGHETSMTSGMPAGPDGMRRRARQMEDDATRFYHQAAAQVSDPDIRTMLASLAAAEAAHGETAVELDPGVPPTQGRVEEIQTEKKNFVLRVIQPGLVGLMDGSVSTLAPVFAAAFATHSSWSAFLVGMAASLGAGISMGFAEALADDGKLSGRGAPLSRGAICGAMTVAGGLGHTMPYLIHDFWTATALSGTVAAIELLVIAWIQWRYMNTPPIAAAAKVMLGGAVVLVVGILIGNS